MKFGRFDNPDHDECVRIVHRALDSGINVIDTADVYSGEGESEQIVGTALFGRRDAALLVLTPAGLRSPSSTTGACPPMERGEEPRWSAVPPTRL